MKIESSMYDLGWLEWLKIEHYPNSIRNLNIDATKSEFNNAQQIELKRIAWLMEEYYIQNNLPTNL